MIGVVIRGKAWKFGDNINADVIIPSRYVSLPTYEEMAMHVMEPIAPDFSKRINKGDIIIGGRNFGCGSSREQAPTALKYAGIGAVVAEYFGRIFFRNAVNIGLPAIECNNVSKKTTEGNQLELDLREGQLRNLTTGETLKTLRLPAFLLDILENGGLIPYLQNL